jgi:hypothetical protein
MLLLGRKTAMEKVATFLLEMDRRLAKAGMMALPMCRRDIGDYLGLTWKPSRARCRSSTTRASWCFPVPARSCCATAAARRHGCLRQAACLLADWPRDDTHCRKMGVPR